MRPIEAAADASPQRARRAIDGALSRDRGRLLGLWAKWNAKPSDAALRDAFASKLQASIAERQRRAAALPTATIDASLPIAGFERPGRHGRPGILLRVIELRSHAVRQGITLELVEPS